MLLRTSLFLSFCLIVCGLLAQNGEQDKVFYRHQKISQEVGGFLGVLENNHQWGAGVAAIGDLDGDFVSELAIGAPGDGNGTLWILWMNKDGTVKSQHKISETDGKFRGKLTPGGKFGSRIEAMGDWNDDGIPDILVGEPYAKIGSLVFGAVWMLMLNQDGTVKSHIKINRLTSGITTRLGKDHRFGVDVACLGDIDGNGVSDLAIGASHDPNKGSGSVWVLLMRDDGGILSVQRILEESGGFAGNLKRGDQFGVAVEALGDLDLDGVGDLAVGACMDDDGDFNTGAVYIMFLNPDGSVKHHQKIFDKMAGFKGYLDFDDRMGISIANLGDMNGDTIPDLAVGAYLDDDGGKDRGAVHILYLNRDGTVKSNHKISETARNFEGYFSEKYRWAQSVSPLGDLNEDGRNDILIGGQWDDDGGKDRGSAWLLFPEAWPDRLVQKKTRPQKTLLVSSADSARIYANAASNADSARVDSLYDLSRYAPSNLVLLLDVSASMNKPGRLPLLKDAVTNLLPYMRPEDKISVITYSGKPAIRLSGIPASEYDKITGVIQGLKSLGETRPERALKMAYEQAQAHYIPNGNNRIIFATDGGFLKAELDKPLEKFASEEIRMSVFYFGKLSATKIRDMKEISQRGKGNAAHITQNSVDEALLEEVKVIRKK